MSVHLIRYLSLHKWHVKVFTFFILVKDIVSCKLQVDSLTCKRAQTPFHAFEVTVLDTAVDQFWRDVYFHAAWKCSREKNHGVCVVVAECDRVKSSDAKMTMSSRLLEEQ